MYWAEALLKSVVLALHACLDEDANRTKYRIAHSLVRADSLGPWVDALDEILTGPAYRVVCSAAQPLCRELSERVSIDDWRHQAVGALHLAAIAADCDLESLPAKVELRRWFSIFVVLRNRTRAHGATRTESFRNSSANLHTALDLLTSHLSIFSIPWAYLHQNLSGKYRVTNLSDADSKELNDLRRKAPAVPVPEGVYIVVGSLRHLPLLVSDVEAHDFFFPNGAFTGKRYELLSYHSDDRKTGSATEYLIPPGKLPDSDTHGLKELDVLGRTLTNLPPVPAPYIHRPTIQDELKQVLLDDRFPLVTLVGRGGIGKTSLAIAVCRDIAGSDRYLAILWFSARDIDLLTEGPKLVRPAVLTKDDISRQFCELVGTDSKTGALQANHFQQSLASQDLGGPILYVFDNFETVRDPIDIYEYLKQFIRPPNKVLITTRARDFKGDYAIEVSGMEPTEAEELLAVLASQSGLADKLSSSVRHEILTTADGHPYILKILVGEFAIDPKRKELKRVVASRDQVLDALFERSFAALSEGARRLFLTVGVWQTAISELVLEAVLISRSAEHFDVQRAIEELRRSSLLEQTRSETGEYFVSAPLAAALFAKTKLSVSPLEPIVRADLNVLHLFGPVNKSEIARGYKPKLRRFFTEIGRRSGEDPDFLNDRMRSMLEMLGARFPEVWRFLAQLKIEQNALYDATHYLTTYLQSADLDIASQIEGWKTLATTYRRLGDLPAYLHALAKLAQFPGIPLSELSTIASDVNHICQDDKIRALPEERQMLVESVAEHFSRQLRTSSHADGRDVSRLAWLLLHLRKEEDAAKVIHDGLLKEPENHYLRNLAAKDFYLRRYTE
ncbi:hypothetical protein BURK1_03314 [Burkholderiales bacterium]|nr:hypothetical protein BURK1_03314 [Burkholderiales bacterium]